jgi:hypothetical protein
VVVEQSQAAQLSQSGGRALEVAGSSNPQMRGEERTASGGESTAESGQ